MPMVRELYPKDWKEIVIRVKEAAGWKIIDIAEEEHDK